MTVKVDIPLPRSLSELAELLTKLSEQYQDHQQYDYSYNYNRHHQYSVTVHADSIRIEES